MEANLTKAEISDLKSLIDRKQETAVALENAKFADMQAQRNLDNELTRLQFRRATRSESEGQQ